MSDQVVISCVGTACPIFPRFAAYRVLYPQSQNLHPQPSYTRSLPVALQTSSPSAPETMAPVNPKDVNVNDLARYEGWSLSEPLHHFQHIHVRAVLLEAFSTLYLCRLALTAERRGTAGDDGLLLRQTSGEVGSK